MKLVSDGISVADSKKIYQPVCTKLTELSDVQGNKNKIIIVKVSFFLAFNIIMSGRPQLLFFCGLFN